MKDDISSGDLAFVGDAVYELYVRRLLVERGAHRPPDEAVKYVCAAAQSEAFSRVEGMLTDEEQDVYHRARNNYHTQNVPKSATPVQYRRATGFEALVGWLYLRGETSRLDKILNTACGLCINCERKTEND